MLVRYRYRLRPTRGQRMMLARVFGCARVVYNDALRLREESHSAGVTISDSEVQRRVITLAKLTPDRAWLAEVPSVALVQACNDARRAYRNWFDSLAGVRKGRKVGHPVFRRKRGRQSVRLTRNGFSLRGQRLSVAKVGEIAVRWSRPLPCEPSSVTVICEPDGRYYASFVVERAATPLPPCGREIGLDVGLSRLGATSDGQIIANPRFLRAKQRKLARAQRALARKAKGSANRVKACHRVAVVHRRVRDTRLDHAHKTALAGPRQPSGLRRGPGRVRARPHPARHIHPRRRVGAAAAPDRRESRAIRADVPPDQPVHPHHPNLLHLRHQRRPQAAERAHLAVRDVRETARPGHQRRHQHPRRRAGGEAKRLRRDDKTRGDPGTSR
jgi:Probable transposase/Helix-turn-helix domain